MGMSMHLAVLVSSGSTAGRPVSMALLWHCRDVLHSHFDRKHHAARVLASLCRVTVNVSLPMVLFLA